MSMMAEIPLNPWIIGLVACLVLQTVALVRLTGPLLVMSLILTLVMVAVGGFTVRAFYLDPSSLWEVFPRLAVPPALVLTIGLLALGSIVGRRRVRQPS